MNYPMMSPDTLVRLRAIELGYKESGLSVAAWLGHKECPYSKEAKEVLARLLASVDPTVVAVSAVAADVAVSKEVEVLLQNTAPLEKADVVLNQVEEAIDQFKKLQDRLDRLGDDADPKDHVNLMKAYITIIDKWVSMQAEIFSIKEMSQFQAITIQFMDEVLTPDQRTDLKNRYRGLQGVKTIMAGDK